MRQIKFRNWNKIDNSFIFFELKDIYYKGIFNRYTDNIRTFGDVNTAQQFTGLLDKNGKEIYEGDKIKGAMYPINSFIMFDERYATFKVQYGTKLVPLGYECEVIGNIYENL